MRSITAREDFLPVKWGSLQTHTRTRTRTLTQRETVFERARVRLWAEQLVQVFSRAQNESWNESFRSRARAQVWHRARAPAAVPLLFRLRVAAVGARDQPRRKSREIATPRGRILLWAVYHSLSFSGLILGFMWKAESFSSRACRWRHGSSL